MNHNHSNAQKSTCTHGCCDSDKNSCNVHECCSENDTVAVMDATSYICPMHSHIKRDMPGKCPECVMNLVPVK